MAEWLKAAVLKTVERKFRGFESYFLRQLFGFSSKKAVTVSNGEMAESVEGARLLSEYTG
jgi:hypothetical protein